MLDKLIEKVEAKIVEVVETMMNKGVYDGNDAVDCDQLLAIHKTLKETINPPFVSWVQPPVPYLLPKVGTVMSPFNVNAVNAMSNMIADAEAHRQSEIDSP